MGRKLLLNLMNLYNRKPGLAVSVENRYGAFDNEDSLDIEETNVNNMNILKVGRKKEKQNRNISSGIKLLTQKHRENETTIRQGQNRSNVTYKNYK